MKNKSNSSNMESELVSSLQHKLTDTYMQKGKEEDISGSHALKLTLIQYYS